MRKLGPNQGFTLLEVLITIGILVVMLAFFASSFSISRLIKIQRHRDVAARVVSQKIESLRADGFDNVGSSTVFTDTQLGIFSSSTASTTVSYYNSSIKQVTVGVYWVESSSTNLYVGATTLVGRSGGL
jgi:prepilin-type N-terminal cleavage/methylation domain-containing protein